MQLRRGQTPDSRSPPQHYCIFKLLSPCGNSQFDDADLQCWQATVTISFSKTKKKGCSLCCFLPRKSPHLYGHVRRCQEGARRRKQQDNKGQGDCVVGSQDLSVTVTSKHVFSDQIVAIIPPEFNVNQFFRFGGRADLQKTFISVEFRDLLPQLRTPAKADVLKVSRCLHGLLHLPGKPSMHCDCMD